MLKGISEVAVSVSRGTSLNTMDLASLVPKKEEQQAPEVVAEEPEQVPKGKLDKLRTGIIVSTLLGENLNRFLASKQFSIAKELAVKLTEAERVKKESQVAVDVAKASLATSRNEGKKTSV